MASLLINLFYSCQSFGRQTPAVLSPIAVIQVKMLTRGVVAVELRRENPSRGGDLHGTSGGVAVG